MSNGKHFKCRTSKLKLWDDQVSYNEEADEFECTCHNRIVDCLKESEFV